MAEQNTQAVVLKQPKDQMIHLDLQHSTDWVVACSIVVSGLISFIGFWITIYVVRKSTESQIESNKDLVENQNQLNEKLFEQQLALQAKKEEYGLEKNIKDRFREAALSFIVSAETFAFYIHSLHDEHANFTFESEAEEGTYQHKVYLGIKEKRDNLYDSRSNLLFFTLEMPVFAYDEIDTKIAEVISNAVNIQNNFYDGERLGVETAIAKYKSSIDETKIILKMILDNILIQKPK